MATLRVVVELFGLARHLTGEKEATVEVGDQATLRDVAAALAQRYPQLLGPIIEPQTATLVAPYVFCREGRQTATSLDAPVEPGEQLVLMFVPAGG